MTLRMNFTRGNITAVHELTQHVADFTVVHGRHVRVQRHMVGWDVRVAIYVNGSLWHDGEGGNERTLFNQVMEEVHAAQDRMRDSAKVAAEVYAMTLFGDL